MRENRTSGSEGGEAQANEPSLPLSAWHLPRVSPRHAPTRFTRGQLPGRNKTRVLPSAPVCSRGVLLSRCSRVLRSLCSLQTMRFLWENWGSVRRGHTKQGPCLT